MSLNTKGYGCPGESLGSHTPNYRRHTPSLDGLRGFALCLVFLHQHYPRQHWNPLSLVASAGWVGVDLFFALSGFLITGILHDTLAAPHSLRIFFVRRSLRIFPVYPVMVGLVVLLARPLQLPLSWRDIPFFAYGANVTRLFQVDPTFGPYLRFWHLWSPDVEEQFYLLWAPLVLLLKTRQRIMQACLVAIVTAILIRCYAAFHVPAFALTQSLLSRMASLLCGALLALGLRGANGERWLKPARLSLVFAAGVVLFGAGLLLSRSLYPETPAMVAVGLIGNDLWCLGLLELALLPGQPVG